MEKDLIDLGLQHPIELINQDAYKMHERLCAMTGKQHDPCVIDIFLAAIDYMQGGSPKKWWEFTSIRKLEMQKRVEA